MADKVLMQHTTKGPASFTSGRMSVESDEDGIIEVPGEAVAAALSHGFVAIAEKPKAKPLAKDAGEGKPVKPAPMKLSKSEDAGEAKAGAGK
jgi:hypothetical protein